MNQVIVDVGRGLPPRAVNHVVTLGLLAGSWAVCTSVVGLLWHVGLMAICASTLVSLLVVWLARTPSPSARYSSISWLWILLAVVVLLIPVVLCFAPPFSGDEVAYGAALPRDYARAGYFFYNADYGPYSAFPSNFEALVTLAITYFHSPTAAKLLNIGLVFGLFVLSADFARLLGTRVPWLAVAGGLFITSSVVMNFSFVAKGDVLAAFFECLSVSMALYYLRSLELRYLILSGGFLGTALGAKYSCLQFALCMVPWLAYFSLRSALPPFRRRWHFASFLLTTALVAAPWYLRNVFLLHDPFFPFFTWLFGGPTEFKDIHAQITREMFNGLAGYSLQTSKPALFKHIILDQFGRTATILGAIGITFAAFGNSANHARLLVSLAITYTVVTFLFGFWEPRYFLLLLACYAAFAAYAISQVLDVALTLPASLESYAALLLVSIISLGSISYEWHVYKDLIKDTIHGESLTSFGNKYVQYFHLATWINEHLTADDKIGIGIDVQPFFYIEKRYFNIHPMSEKGDLQEMVSDEEFLSAFRRLNLTMLAFYPWQSEPGYTEARTPKMHEFMAHFYGAVRSLVEKGKLVSIGEVDGVQIYQIAYGG